MEQEANKLDLTGLGSFDFTPDWARGDAKVSVGKIRPERTERDGDASFNRSGRDSASPKDSKPFGDRKPMGDRKPFKRGGFDRKPFAERPKPLDCEVKVLPETKALGTIIRKLQGDFHAYKLKDLAYFFLDNPSSVLLKVSLKPSPSPSPSSSPSPSISFYQCKACGFATTDKNELVDHILNSHIGEYYDSKEIDCEPPKGNFNCVAKCGLSGVLLGPPNIHEFNAVVKEMIRTRYPEMSESQYRSHIEMVRDSESIEAWRQTATKKTVFFAKGEADKEGAKQYTREQAEGEFKRNILDSLVDQPKNLMITAEMALKSPVKPLVWAVRDAIEAERRAPYGMCFALRGAFHHRKLNFFRVNDNRGQEFVTGVEFKSFDAEHAIPELAKVAKFVADNPCSSKQEIAPDAESEKHLAWLVSTGHVVAFTNGVYSAVEKFPKYGPQWRKRAAVEGSGKDSASPVETTADAKETPSAEVAPAAGDAESLPLPSVEEKKEETVKAEEVKDESTAVVAE